MSDNEKGNNNHQNKYSHIKISFINVIMITVISYDKCNQLCAGNNHSRKYLLQQ